MKIKIILLFCEILLMEILVSAEKLKYEYREIHNSSGILNVARHQDVYYLTSTTGIQVARLSSEGQVEPIRFISKYPLLGEIFISGKYLLIHHQISMHVFDLGDPENPVWVLEIPIHNGQVRMEGDYLYVARFIAGIDIYYLGNLPDMILVGEFTEEDVGYPAAYWGFNVSNGICYGVLGGCQIMQIVDCRKPIRPTLLRELYSPPGEYWDGWLETAGPWMFITYYDSNAKKKGKGPFSMKCYQFNEYWEMEEVLSFPTQDIIWVYQTNGDQMLAFEDLSDQNHLFDLSGPDAPELIVTWDTPLPASNLLGRAVWQPPFLFLLATKYWVGVFDENIVDGYNLLSVFCDIPKIVNYDVRGNENRIAIRYREDRKQKTALYERRPGEPLTLCWIGDEMDVLALKDNVLFVRLCDENNNCVIGLYDISDPAAPQFIKEIPNVYVYGGGYFFIQGRFGVAINGEYGAVVFDVSDPSDPLELCRWKPECLFFFQYGMVEDQFLYVCDIEVSEIGGKVWVVDISNYEAPETVQVIEEFFLPNRCLVYNSTYLVVADSLRNVIVDISDMENPEVVNYLFIPYFFELGPCYAKRLGLYDHYLVSGWGGGGIWFYDLDCPWNDEFVGYIPVSGYSYDHLVLGNDVYIADSASLVGVEFEIIRDGDLNEDGAIDGLDLLLMKHSLAENLSWRPDPKVMDMNHDGKINTLDMLLLSYKVAGI